MYTDVAGGASMFIQTIVMGCRGEFGGGRLRFIATLAATSAASPQLVSTCSRSEESQCEANVCGSVSGFAPPKPRSDWQPKSDFCPIQT